MVLFYVEFESEPSELNQVKHYISFNKELRILKLSPVPHFCVLIIILIIYIILSQGDKSTTESEKI